MGELAATGHIADRIDAAVRRLEALVDGDAVAVARDAGALKRKAVDVRLAAGGDEEMAALDRRAVIAKDDLDLCARAFDAGDYDVAANDDALARERIEHDRRAFGVFARERLRCFQHRDRAPEPAKGLRELEPDRAGADNDKVFRPRGEIEHALVGEIGHRVEAGDGRERRRGAGGDDEAPCRDLDAVPDSDGIAILEAGCAFDDPHAEPVEALLRIIRRDRRDDTVHVAVDLAEIDLRRWRRHAECARIPNGAGALARGDQRFRGDAAGIEAFAAHLALLDEHHRHTEDGGGGGNRKPAGARANDTDVGC